MKFLDEIEEHFSHCYPAEGCGVIAVVRGKKKWFPCTNVAEADQDFIIDSTEYLKLLKTTDIIAIVHSHPDSSSSPSASDIANCNALGKPYYIFSYPDMDLTIVNPETCYKDLFGREYKFGVSDCFEAARDYLSTVNIHIDNRAAFEDDWWNKGLNYFSQENMEQWGFYPTPLNKIRPHDILIFKVFTEVPNHCGVYLGDEIFYHHAVNRLSCRESLYPMWAEYLVGAYRYEA